MKEMKKRLLIERHPQLFQGGEVPLSYHYAELYTSIITDEEGKIIRSPYDKDYLNNMEVRDYNTNKYSPNKIFYKPISRNFNIKQNDK